MTSELVSSVPDRLENLSCASKLALVITVMITGG